MPTNTKFAQRNMAAGKPEMMKEVIVKKTVVAPVTKKKEGMVDVNKYVERLPGGAIREIKYGEYKTLSNTGRNVQTFTPAQFEKIKSRL